MLAGFSLPLRLSGDGCCECINSAEVKVDLCWRGNLAMLGSCACPMMCPCFSSRELIGARPRDSTLSLPCCWMDKTSKALQCTIEEKAVDEDTKKSAQRFPWHNNAGLGIFAFKSCQVSMESS